jgi:hypothetical protein
MALELQARGQLQRIVPVAVGDPVGDLGAQASGKLSDTLYGHFFQGGCAPAACPDVQVHAVESRVAAHLERLGMGGGLLVPPEERTVRATLRALLAHQGVVFEGLRGKALEETVDTIVRVALESAPSSESADTASVLCEVGVRHQERGQVTRRGALMQRLRDWAETEGAHRIAVVGQGGSGKSTLAQCFVTEAGRALHPSVRLVFVLQRSDVMRGYRDLLRELKRILGREDADPDKDEDVRVLVHALLRDEAVAHAWMGVLDDLPGPAELAGHGMEWLLEPGARGFPWGSGKTVVTSRSAEWANDQTFSSGVTVGNYEADEGLAFLTGAVPDWGKDEAGVAAVARRLHLFPLALASAAGCARKFKMGPRQYLEELDKKVTSAYMQKWRGRKRAAGEYPEEYLDVVRMTWEKLAVGEDGDEVQALLRKLAFVDPCNIPVGAFADFQLLLPVLDVRVERFRCSLTL